uniref:Reverse transcriptase zinc-binding domain-containing protein n=1 Tax=Cajanus cajan TaxID=3821 RepID=A0A151RCP6_CAJCA|nr:hypothetical protein KK1_038436 [Cajanus cajan]
MTYKDVYTFVRKPHSKVKREQAIWNKAIPPSKTFTVWRLIHKRIPTEDVLQKRGVIITSICSHCYNAYEIADDLFFFCPFAGQLWKWLATITNQSFTAANIISILSNKT